MRADGAAAAVGYQLLDSIFLIAEDTTPHRKLWLFFSRVWMSDLNLFLDNIGKSMNLKLQYDRIC